MLTKILKSFCVLVLIATMSGCPTLSNITPQTIVTYVQDAELVLGTIQSFINTYFANHSNPTLQSTINADMQKAQTALDAALRATQGVQNITQDQINVAFADFQAAYADIIGLIGPLGVQQSSSVKKASMSGGTLTIPTPIVIVQTAK